MLGYYHSSQDIGELKSNAKLLHSKNIDGNNVKY